MLREALLTGRLGMRPRVARIIASVTALLAASLRPAIAACEPDTEPLRITLRAGKAFPADIRATSWHDGTPSLARLTGDTATRATEVTIEEGCHVDAVVVLEAPGLVSSPIEVFAGPACVTAPHQAALVPATSVKGRLAVPEGQAMPAWAWLEVSPCAPPGEEAPALRYPFSVSEGGTFTLSAPAGCLRTSASAEGLASAPLPETSVASGAIRDLGTIALRPSATISTRVVMAGGAGPLAGAVVRAVPATLLERAVCAAVEGGSRGFSGGVRTRQGGWAAITGLRPGDYALFVEAEGCAATVSAPVNAAQGETSVPDVEVGPPGRLEVGTTTLAELSRQGLILELVARPMIGERTFPRCERSAEADREQRLALDGLAPGRWAADVFVVAGATRHRVAFDEVDVPSGGTVEFAADLAAKVVRGRIEYRHEPVVGRFVLFLEDPQLTTVAFTGFTDENGRFVAFVDRRGLYAVAVEGERPELSTTVPHVELALDGEEVLVELPDGSVSGSVVGADGRAVPTARVAAVGLAEPGSRGGEAIVFPSTATAAADSSGAFVLEGLAPGRWELRATHDDRESAAKVVDLSRGGSRGGVILVLEQTKKLSGFVFAGAGAPVAGAMVTAFVAPAAPGGPWLGRDTNTESNGRFEIDLGPDAGSIANLQVAAAGLPLSAFRVSVGEGHALRLPSAGGAMRLLPPKGGWPAEALRRLCLIGPDGRFLAMGVALAAPGSVRGRSASDPVTVPAVAPGAWRLVWLEPTLITVDNLFAGAPGRPVLASLEIVPGTVAEVQVNIPER